MVLHRVCTRSIVVVYTIILGLFFPLFFSITQLPTIASVRGSLCGQDVVRSRRACFVTMARSHVFRIGFSTRTVCCGIEAQVPSQSGHGTTCISCDCWRNAFISPLDRDDTAGRFDLYLLPFRSSYGDVRGCFQLGLEYNTIYNTISFILEWTTSLDTSSRTLFVREEVCPRHVERRVT